MSTPTKTVLCHYQYNPLDELATSTLPAKANNQRFYRDGRLVTEVEGTVERTIVQYQDHPLAQHVRDNGTVRTALFATDLSRTVLLALGAGGQPNPFAYTVYGHRPFGGGLLSLLGFNGERPDTVTGHYLLGNGYRAFNPVLMRFNSPDNLSPFGSGGLNPYAYCVGDPVNREDPSGHISFSKFFSTVFKRPLRALGIIGKSKKADAMSKLSAEKERQATVPLSPDIQQFPNGERSSGPDYTPSTVSTPSHPEELPAFLQRRNPVGIVDINNKFLAHVKISDVPMQKIRDATNNLCRSNRANWLNIEIRSSVIAEAGRLDPLPPGQYYKGPNPNPKHFG